VKSFADKTDDAPNSGADSSVRNHLINRQNLPIGRGPEASKCMQANAPREGAACRKGDAEA
jgi:hypothetical protein